MYGSPPAVGGSSCKTVQARNSTEVFRRPRKLGCARPYVGLGRHGDSSLSWRTTLSKVRRLLGPWVPSGDWAQLNGQDQLRPSQHLARTNSHRRVLTVARFWRLSWRLGTAVFEPETPVFTTFLGTGLYSSNGSRSAHTVPPSGGATYQFLRI